MNKRVLLAVAAAALVLGVGTALLWPTADEPPTRRPDWSLQALGGMTHTAADFDGQLVLINFWATWCTPCLKEIPLLIKAQNDYAAAGLQVLGPAMDQLEAVSSYSASAGINYPVLPGDTTIVNLMDAFGDNLGALPFTVLIGRDGMIRERHWGALSESQLNGLIKNNL